VIRKIALWPRGAVNLARMCRLGATMLLTARQADLEFRP
jgi:hypothetical protein